MPSTISRHRSLLGNPPPKALGVRRSYLIGVGTDMLGSDVVGTVVGIMFGIWVGSLAHSLTHAPTHSLSSVVVGIGVGITVGIEGRPAIL